MIKAGKRPVKEVGNVHWIIGLPAQTLVNMVNVVGAIGKGITLDEVEKAEAAEGTQKQEGKIV